jgi:hypothetical protein
LTTVNRFQEFEAVTDRVVKCRFCRHSLRHAFVDLGTSPLCQTQSVQQIYHERVRYLSFHYCELVFQHHGLTRTAGLGELLPIPTVEILI